MAGPYGHEIRFLAPPSNFSQQARWHKDGLVISETGSSSFTIPAASESDSGVYTFAMQFFQIAISSSVTLTVEPPYASKFVNYSSMVRLSPGNDVQVTGFVVVGDGPKQILIRAVGDSLREFGIENPVAAPRFQLYKGKERAGFGNLGLVLPPAYWPELFANAGAFPLAGNEVAFVSYNAGNLDPGAYTIHVTDDTQAGGTVLVEVYEYSKTPSLSTPVIGVKR